MKEELEKISVLMKTQPDLGKELFKIFQQEHRETLSLLGVMGTKVWYMGVWYDVLFKEQYRWYPASQGNYPTLAFITVNDFDNVPVNRIAYVERI